MASPCLRSVLKTKSPNERYISPAPNRVVDIMKCTSRNRNYDLREIVSYPRCGGGSALYPIGGLFLKKKKKRKKIARFSGYHLRIRIA